MWSIYRSYNMISGLSYVGQTLNTVERRWSAHVRLAGRSDQFALQKAIRKYGGGLDVWQLETIATASSLDEANQLEIFYISKYDCYRNGYNMTEGGHHTASESVSRMWCNRDPAIKEEILAKLKQGSIGYFANVKDHGEKIKAGIARRDPTEHALISAKIAKARLNSYEVTSPDGTKYLAHNLKQFCEVHDLSIQMMYKSDRKGTTYQGWSCHKRKET